MMRAADTASGETNGGDAQPSAAGAEPTAAFGGFKEALWALGHGGHTALLNRAQVSEAEIDDRILHGWTVESLRGHSGHIWTQAREWDVKRFCLGTLRRFGAVHSWTDHQDFSGLCAALKICRLDLPRDAPLDDETANAAADGSPPAAPTALPARDGAPTSGLTTRTEATEEKSFDDGSSVGTTSESSNATWMEPEGAADARLFDDGVMYLFPAQLLVASTAELAAQSVPSLADGNPPTARQFRNDKEQNDVVREIFKVWHARQFGKAELNPEVDRLCAFSSVPVKDKELLKFLLKSYNNLHHSASLQLNLLLAAVTQVQHEVSDWAECESNTPFTLQSNTPEGWALLQVLVAALAYPVVKVCVELVNMIAGAYAMTKTPVITPFTPVSNLVRIEIDQASLLKKRTDEIAVLALMNPAPPKKARTESSFSGRATTSPRGGGQRARGSSNAHSSPSRGRGQGSRRRYDNLSYTRDTADAADPSPDESSTTAGRDSRGGRGRGARGGRGRGGGRGGDRGGGRGGGYSTQRR